MLLNGAVNAAACGVITGARVCATAGAGSGCGKRSLTASASTIRLQLAMAGRNKRMAHRTVAVTRGQRARRAILLKL
jgi:hypothetical protein